MSKGSIYGTNPVKSYFSQKCHIVHELGLTHHERTVYDVLLRICGENASCFRTNKEMARICNMGRSTYVNCKNRLAQPFELLGGKPLITVEIQKRGNIEGPSLVNIVDIMEENVAFFKNTPHLSIFSKKDSRGQELADPQPGTGFIKEEPFKNNPSLCSKQQQPPYSLPSLRSVSECESPQTLSDESKDATTKTFSLPKEATAAANNKWRANKPKDDKSLTNNQLSSLLENTYGSMLGQSGEGPPPPVVPATPVRASHGAAFEKRLVVPSAAGMTVTKKPDAAADEDKKILLNQLKDSFSDEQMKIAEEYIDCFYDEVFSANSPPGVVAAAVKRGYAKSKIADAKQWKRDHKKASTQQQLGSEKDDLAQANYPYAKAMYDRLKPHYMHRLFDVSINKTHVIVTFLRKGKQQSHVIGFLENGFHGKIDELESSCREYIQWIKKEYGHKLKDFHSHNYLEEEIPL